MRQWFKNNLIAIDQLLNTLLNGSPDESLSARAWRVEQQGKYWGIILRPIIDLIFFLDKNHCYQSFLSEFERKQLPLYYKDI